MSRDLLFNTPQDYPRWRLEHYTEEVFSFERDRTYRQNEPRGFLKPRGLWVSVAGEDDWPSWCQSEEFRLDALEHLSVITLAEDANLMVVSTPEGLDAFHEEYAVNDDPMLSLGPWASPGSEKRFWSLDWGAVAQKFQGVVMAPYLWSRRLDGPMWYYGVDVASGCIWDLSAIASVEVVK